MYIVNISIYTYLLAKVITVFSVLFNDKINMKRSVS